MSSLLYKNFPTISYCTFSFTITAFTSEDFHVIFNLLCNMITGFRGIIGVLKMGLGLRTLKKFGISGVDDFSESV